MRNLKKFLALVMALVMAFSLMLSASAANPVKTFDDADQITEAFVEAADVLTGMKVFQGDERGFAPGATITRAETAALIYRLATGDVNDTRAGLYANYGNFKDVNEGDWFAGYVGYCANAGYIKGHNGYFSPYGQVTGYEALAMILRAVGYDKNHEFEGATWQTNVSALGTRLGVLDDVKTTDYANTLHLASRRDVVASILFNAAAYVNTVTYTPSLGYETNKVSNGTADKWNGATLGYVNFGLDSVTGIIVGNQDTGEDYTKVGLELAADGTDTGRGSYEYVSGAENIVRGSNLTLAFNTDTGIDMFGHKFKVWYDVTSDSATQNITVNVAWDSNNNQWLTGTNKVADEYKTVYATFDKATLAAHVYATDSNITSTASANGAVGLRTAATGAGFARTNTTRWSASYSRIDSTAQANLTASHQTVPTGLTAATLSDSPVSTYYLVSNNDDKTVDVVVREDNELARIDKKDTTANTKTLTLGNTTATTSTYGLANDGVIRESRLTPGSIKDLGSIVFATMIIGTDKVLDSVAWGSWMNGYYKLEAPATEENQIVASSYTDGTGGNKWNNDDGDAISINLADGSTLRRSGIMDNTTDTNIAMISKCVTELTNTNMVFNQTYTIYKDKVGRFIGVTTGTDYTFLYGTFGDYEVGGLGTGTIKYAVTGVNWEGEKVENHVLTSIRTSSSNTVYSAGNLATAYNQVQVASGDISFPITKKDLGNTSGVTNGNRILTGSNIGFAINPAGNLLNHDGTTNFVGTVDYAVRSNDGKLLARVASGNDWRITAADAANGFADVTAAKDGTLLATNNTTFIVVSGHGTSDLDVKVYHGLSEFLNGSSQVTIDNTTVRAGNTNGYGYTYYMTTADRYNNMDTTNNNLLDRVIMTDKNVTGRSTDSLYFNANNVRTGTRLNGQYEQFVMYNNGEKGYYFIESDEAGAIALGSNLDKSGDRFYTLTQTKTVNGQPVYHAEVVAPDGSGVAGDGIRTDGNFCWANADVAPVGYGYLSTSDLSTARIGGTVSKANGIYTNLATDSVIYRVDNAKVVDLTNGRNNGGTGTVSHAAFESVLDLNNAISSGWGIMDVAIVNNGLDVSVIYVLSVKAPSDT